jgi:hypothetical protein
MIQYPAPWTRACPRASGTGPESGAEDTTCLQRPVHLTHGGMQFMSYSPEVPVGAGSVNRKLTRVLPDS